MTESIKRNIHFPDKGLLERLKKLAKKRDRKINYMVVEAVKEKVEREE